MICRFLIVILCLAWITAWANEYETYDGQRFEIIHETELGQYVFDTVEAVSKTERIGETELRLINNGRRIIKPPDYINRLEK